MVYKKLTDKEILEQELERLMKVLQSHPYLCNPVTTVTLEPALDETRKPYIVINVRSEVSLTELAEVKALSARIKNITVYPDSECENYLEVVLDFF